MSKYRCAVCAREVEYEGRLPTLYPFCSARCQYVDLGKWLREDYTIDRELTLEELGSSPPPPQPPAD